MQENLMVINNAYLKSIPNLEQRSKMTHSNESLESVYNTVASYVTSTFKSMSDSFQANISRFTSNNLSTINLKTLLKTEGDLNSILAADIKLSTIAKVQVPVTLGLKTDLLTTVDKLNTVGKAVEKSVVELLKEVDMIISKMLSDKNYLKQTRPIKDGESHTLYRLLYENLESIIDVNGVKDRKDLEKLLPNIASLKTISDKLKENDAVYAKIDTDAIKNYTKKISERILVLQQYFNENPEIEISRNILEDFGMKVEQAAKIVTFTASFLHLNQQSVDMFTELVKMIDKYKK